MKIVNLSIDCYGTTPSGSFNLHDPDTSLRVQLNEEDCHRLFSICLEIFEKRQAAIAKTVANMRVAALPAPGIIEGSFTNASDEGVSF